MSTHIANFKNFLRHGKAAKETPTTNVSNTHAHAQPSGKAQYGISEPAVPMAGQRQQPNVIEHNSVAGGQGRDQNVAAQAGGIAAHQAAKGQKLAGGITQSDLAAIVAEERAKANQLPKYPGLDKYILREKMGDGAFSNVYRARDSTTGQEVAIKVVRKFEMNSNQVRPGLGTSPFLSFLAHFNFESWKPTRV